MADVNTRSLQQIRSDAEQTRAGLTNTVEELKTAVIDTASDIRRRISPNAIKAEVSEYIQSRGEQLMDDVASAARRNPMQAVAVGASLAYPLMRVARAIPFPVLMVGAGLFFAGSKTGKAASQKASGMVADLSDEIRRRAHDASDLAKDTAISAESYAADQYGRISAVVADGSSQLKDAAKFARASVLSGPETVEESTSSAVASVAHRASALGDDVLRVASSSEATARDIASRATDAARNAVHLASDTTLEVANSVRTKAADASADASKTFARAIDQRPMLVAGLGLLIGGLIASALPRSDFEDNLVGEASSSVKRSAEDAASQALTTATTAVAEIYQETSQRANEEGLTTEGVAKAAQDIRQRVQRVAEAALSTAFEPTKETPPSHGEQDHG